MKKVNNQKEQNFKDYLEKIEDPNYDGVDASWGLPEDSAPLEKAKYEICEKILTYQQDISIA